MTCHLVLLFFFNLFRVATNTKGLLSLKSGLNLQGGGVQSIQKYYFIKCQQLLVLQSPLKYKQ